MIGIFDSGVGGLTVLRALKNLLPQQRFLYLADFGYAPYGNRSKEDILQRTQSILRWMEQGGVSLVVVACHTSSSLLNQGGVTQGGVTGPEGGSDLSLVTMLQPTLDSILLHPRRHHWNKGLVVLATALTIQRGALVAALKARNFDLPLYPVACPDLASFIETSQWGKARAYVRSLMPPHPVDALVYGCTHYPLMEPWWTDPHHSSLVSSPAPLRIDPAERVAIEVKERLSQRLKLHDAKEFLDAPRKSFDSKASHVFSQYVSTSYTSRGNTKEHRLSSGDLFYYTGDSQEGYRRLRHHWPEASRVQHTPLDV